MQIFYVRNFKRLRCCRFVEFDWTVWSISPACAGARMRPPSISYQAIALSALLPWWLRDLRAGGHQWTRRSL